MRLALALILLAVEGLSFPALTICVARAFALAACSRSGIGYFLLAGIPNEDLGRLLRFDVLSNPIIHSYRVDGVPKPSDVFLKHDSGCLLLVPHKRPCE